jgi:thiamine biosynthesis lipoprotein
VNVSEPVVFSALGTTIALVVTDDAARDVASEMLHREIDAIDRACSRFRDDSELSMLNANGGSPMRVSDLFMEALDTALRAARITRGAVDPTVGTSMRLLGYDRSFDALDRNGPPLEVSVRRVPGWQTIEVDRTRSTVRVPTGVELDFGATAKALCADRAAAAIADATGAGTLLSLGGDIAARGTPPENGWPLVVADSYAAGVNGAGRPMIINSGGLATSGTTVRRWRRGAVELHHVVNPMTGRPAAEQWRTVTVAAGCCVDANIASTAAIVMGADAPEWLEARKLPARLVTPDGAVVCVAGWPPETQIAC